MIGLQAGVVIKEILKKEKQKSAFFQCGKKLYYLRIDREVCIFKTHFAYLDYFLGGRAVFFSTISKRPPNKSSACLINGLSETV